MLKFRTKVACIYSQHVPFFTNPGSEEVDVYDSKYDDDGHLVVFKSGVSNLQDYIDSFADSCNINNLVKRFDRGEISDFNFVEGQYMDVTGLPTSYADMVNKVKEGEDTFNSLPVEVREKFNNNPVEFFTQYGSDAFFDTLGLSKYKESEVKLDEQKSDE